MDIGNLGSGRGSFLQTAVFVPRKIPLPCFAEKANKELTFTAKAND